jgi:predicted nucleotidyltransferase
MLTNQEKAVLKEFKTDLEKVLGDQLIQLKLFGSKARGDDQADSDIDVLVIVTTDDWRLRDKIYDVATDMLLQTDVCISPKVISQSRFIQLCKERTSFMHNVSKDALTI